MYHLLLYRWVSLLLAVSLLIGTVPREWLHLCASHQDTVHSPFEKNKHYSVAHHHCEGLQVCLPPFATPLPILKIGTKPSPYFVCNNQPGTQRYVGQEIIPAHRGPPYRIVTKHSSWV